MNLTAKLSIAIALAVALVASGWFLRSWYDDSVKVAILEAANAAQRETAAEIAKLEIKNTVIHNKIVERTYHEPVYLDCRHTPDEYEYIKELFK